MRKVCKKKEVGLDGREQRESKERKTIKTRQIRKRGKKCEVEESKYQLTKRNYKEEKIVKRKEESLSREKGRKQKLKEGKRFREGRRRGKLKSHLGINIQEREGSGGEGRKGIKLGRRPKEEKDKKSVLPIILSYSDCDASDGF